jgi:hypothetical protein
MTLTNTSRTGARVLYVGTLIQAGIGRRRWRRRGARKPDASGHASSIVATNPRARRRRAIGAIIPLRPDGSGARAGIRAGPVPITNSRSVERLLGNETRQGHDVTSLTHDIHVFEQRSGMRTSSASVHMDNSFTSHHSISIRAPSMRAVGALCVAASAIVRADRRSACGGCSL